MHRFCERVLPCSAAAPAPAGQPPPLFGLDALITLLICKGHESIHLCRRGPLLWGSSFWPLSQKGFCLEPGLSWKFLLRRLSWKFLLRRSWPDEKRLLLLFPGLSLLLRSNQVSLLGISFLSQIQMENQQTRRSGWKNGPDSRKWPWQARESLW